MAIPTSGSVSLGDLQTEFGGTNPIEIDEYYRGGTYVPNTATNTGVPLSGTISLGDFYGASAAAATPTYSVTAPASINEGSSGTINVSTTNVADGTTLYWTVTPSADFGTTSGNFSITSNAGSFTVTPTADSTTEGAETGTIQIRTGSTSGTIVASDTFTINDTSTTTPTYSVTAPASINEGSSGTINVSTTNVGSFTTLYWTVTPSGDFATASGSFAIVNNAGSFSITPSADLTTEGPETGTIQIRTGSTSGTIVASDTFTINDTSTTPASASYNSFTRSRTSINEDNSTTVTFTVNTTGVANGTTVGYTISGISAADINLSSLTGNITISSNTGSLAFYAIADSTTEGNETATIALNSTDSAGNPTGSLSSSVVINDTSVCPTANQLVSTFCSGYDLYGTYTDGSCGTYNALIQSNSSSCGYVPPLSVSVSGFSNGGATDYNWNGQTTSTNALTATSGTASASASGGTGVYSYQWSLVSYTQATGDATITAASFSSGQSSSTTGSVTAWPNTKVYDSTYNIYYCGESISVTIRCTVTDSNGSTASADITTNISFFWQQ